MTLGRPQAEHEEEYLQSSFSDARSLPGAAAAATRRVASRLNATVTAEHREALLRERSLLLDRVLDGSPSSDDRRRLRRVEWSLDRIEDALYGASLDDLEDAVRAYELMGARINALTEEIADAVETNTRKAKSRR